MRFNPLVPELYVTNLEESLDFYVKLLGFRIEYQRENPRFVFLSYYGSQLMLQQREDGDAHTGPLERPYGRGVNFQIDTPDVQHLARLLSAAGYSLYRGVEDRWYEAGGSIVGSREIQALDPDGYLLRFSHDLGTRSKDDA